MAMLQSLDCPLIFSRPGVPPWSTRAGNRSLQPFGKRSIHSDEPWDLMKRASFYKAKDIIDKSAAYRFENKTKQNKKQKRKLH